MILINLSIIALEEICRILLAMGRILGLNIIDLLRIMLGIGMMARICVIRGKRTVEMEGMGMMSKVIL